MANSYAAARGNTNLEAMPGSLELSALLFGGGDCAKALQALLEHFADHGIGTQQQTNSACEKRTLARHGPGYARAATFRLEIKVGVTEARHRPFKIELQFDVLIRLAFEDRHLASADVIISVPTKDRTNAALWTFKRVFCIRIELRPRRPRIPLF